MFLELADVPDRNWAREGPEPGSSKPRQPTEEEEAEAEAGDGRGQAEGVGAADVETRHREEQGDPEGDLQEVERILPAQGGRGWARLKTWNAGDETDFG